MNTDVWAYSTKFSVSDNSGTSLTDFQVLVELNSVNFDFSKAQTDGLDIRFTDSHNNELSYWIEEWDITSQQAKIWVNVPSIPAYGETKLIIYYGNPAAESGSDGEATFVLFDTFGGEEIDQVKWEVYNCGSTTSPYISDGTLLIPGGDHYNRGLKAKTTLPSDNKEMRVKYWIESSSDFNGCDGDPSIGFASSDTALDSSRPNMYMIIDNDEFGPGRIQQSWDIAPIKEDSSYLFVNDGTDILFWNSGGRITESYDSRGKWSQEAVARIGNHFFGELIEEDGINHQHDWVYSGIYDFDMANIPIIFANNDNLDVKYDWIFVRQFIENEPLVSIPSELDVSDPVVILHDDFESYTTLPTENYNYYGNFELIAFSDGNQALSHQGTGVPGKYSYIIPKDLVITSKNYEVTFRGKTDRWDGFYTGIANSSIFSPAGVN